MFDTLPVCAFDLLTYPSINCHYLIERYHSNSDGKSIKVSGNPFLIDFSKELPILGRAEPFKQDKEVRRRAVCKSIYNGREIY